MKDSYSDFADKVRDRFAKIRLHPIFVINKNKEEP